MRHGFGGLAKALAVLSIALAASGAASAQPAVMTFTPIACATGVLHTTASPYAEAGFTLTQGFGGNFGTWCADSYNYAGPGMWIGNTNATASLTRSGGGTFSINAIELAHLYDASWPAQSFTFIGNFNGGGTVSQTFTIGAQAAGHPTFTPYVFDATWTNLVSVTFAPQDYSYYYQFTNVVLDAAGTTVPEPASMALLGTGLVGVFGAVHGRRRNQST